PGVGNGAPKTGAWAGQLAGRLGPRPRRGRGTTLTGGVSPRVDPQILTPPLRSVDQGAVVVTGTKGTSTTAALLRHILEAEGRRTVANQAGANLIYGVTAAMVNRASWSGRLNANVGLFEIDEASLPRLVQEIAPGTII